MSFVVYKELLEGMSLVVCRVGGMTCLVSCVRERGKACHLSCVAWVDDLYCVMWKDGLGGWHLS